MLVVQAWATISGLRAAEAPRAAFKHFSQALQQLSHILSPSLFHFFVYFWEGVFEPGFLELAILELDL